MRRPVGRKVFATIGRCPFTRSVLKETTMSKLFTPAQVGPYRLSHRVVMAPLTRMRSDPGDIPSDLMVKYYTQRASNGGLIVSEATPVSIRGNGYAGAPGIYSDGQISGWQRVTDAVHAKGGRIFQQLWHVGRQSHVDLQPNGQAPIAPSPATAPICQGHLETARPFAVDHIFLAGADGGRCATGGGAGAARTADGGAA